MNTIHLQQDYELHYPTKTLSSNCYICDKEFRGVLMVIRRIRPDPDSTLVSIIYKIIGFKEICSKECLEKGIQDHKAELAVELAKL